MEDRDARSLLLQKGEPSVVAWIKAVQVLEQSGHLGQRDEMKITIEGAGK